MINTSGYRGRKRNVRDFVKNIFWDEVLNHTQRGAL